MGTTAMGATSKKSAEAVSTTAVLPKSTATTKLPATIPSAAAAAAAATAAATIECQDGKG